MQARPTASTAGPNPRRASKALRTPGGRSSCTAPPSPPQQATGNFFRGGAQPQAIRRVNVRIRWQFAQTASQRPISSSTACSVYRCQWDTSNRFGSPGRWSRSITNGGNVLPQSTHGRPFAASIAARRASRLFLSRSRLRSQTLQRLDSPLLRVRSRQKSDSGLASLHLQHTSERMFVYLGATRADPSIFSFSIFLGLRSSV